MQEWNDLAFEEYTTKVRLKPGARDYLEHLRSTGAKLGVASTLMPSLRDPTLAHLGVDGLFDAVCGIEEVGGLNKDHHQDSEGCDRIAYGLPYNQDNVIEALAAANPNLAVCIISGNAVAMPWVAQVPAIVECWYCGSQAGNSIADVVFGKVNPSGKLPFTFPVKIEDSPAHALDAYTCGPDVKYKESIYVGYRWFDTKGIKPLFAFGHGLSYTEFEYSDFKASSSISANGTLKASVKVKNIGSREGKEVVQLYIGEQSPVLDRPAKELKAFEKVSLAPGETKTVKFEIPASDLAYFNAESHSWVLDPAHTFTAYFAAASDDIRGTVEFRTK